jgi:hypothetical protein
VRTITVAACGHAWYPVYLAALHSRYPYLPQPCTPQGGPAQFWVSPFTRDSLTQGLQAAPGTGERAARTLGGDSSGGVAREVLTTSPIRPDLAAVDDRGRGHVRQAAHFEPDGRPRLLPRSHSPICVPLCPFDPFLVSDLDRPFRHPVIMVIPSVTPSAPSHDHGQFCCLRSLAWSHCVR